MTEININSANDFIDFFCRGTSGLGSNEDPFIVNINTDIDINDINDEDEDRISYKEEYNCANLYIKEIKGNNHIISNISYIGSANDVRVFYSLYREDSNTKGGKITHLKIRDINFLTSGARAYILVGFSVIKDIQAMGKLQSSTSTSFIGTLRNNGLFYQVAYSSFEGELQAGNVYGLMTDEGTLSNSYFKNCFFSGKLLGTNKTVIFSNAGWILWVNCYAKNVFTSMNNMYAVINNNSFPGIYYSYLTFSQEMIDRINSLGNTTYINIYGGASGDKDLKRSQGLLVQTDGIENSNTRFNNNYRGYLVASEQLKSAEWLRSQGWAI